MPRSPTATNKTPLRKFLINAKGDNSYRYGDNAIAKFVFNQSFQKAFKICKNRWIIGTQLYF